MATIEKRGNGYRITVSAGYDMNGKQIRRKMTWTPDEKMTARQVQKELQKQAALFEHRVETGQFLDGKITVAEFSERWFDEYVEKQLKRRTIARYHALMERILPIIGHIKLEKLQPHHLMSLYNKLSESGIREDITCTPCENFTELMKAAGYSRASLAAAAGVSAATVSGCTHGRNITKLSADKISAVLKTASFTEVSRNGGRLSKKTVLEYHRMLSSMLTAAVQWQVIFSNPCERVKPPKADRKEAAALDAEQAAELIRCLQNEPLKYRTAIMLLLYTGFRRGELCGLEWDDIDLEHGKIRVNKTVLYSTGIGTYEDTAKTESSNRSVTIPADMIALLKLYRAEQAEKRLLLGAYWKNSGKVFTNEDGAVINPDGLSGWFKKFIRRNNLPDIHLHTLRHTAATLLIAAGADVATVSKRLGHANKTTTLNIYTHAIKSADEAAANMLQDIYRSAQEKAV